MFSSIKPNTTTKMPALSEEEKVQVIERNEQEKHWDDLREVFRKVSQGIARNNKRSGERAIWELLQNAGDVCGEGDADIELVLTTSDLIFKHHGRAFTLKTLEDLIRQRSSKDDKTKVGRFGTGFMTTHVFNRKVFVSGSCHVEQGNKKLFLPFENFCLNRDFDECEDFIQELDQALKNMKDILSHDYIEKDDVPTIFRYPVPGDKLQHISEQLEVTSLLMPYVLAFNDSIKKCVIDIQCSEKKFSFVKQDEKNTPCAHDSNIWLCETTIDFSGHPIVVNTLRNDKEGTDRIVLPPLPEGFDDVSKIPSQFLFFPLLGSEDFGTHFILHSSRLTPTEPRDSYELPKDNDNLTKVYKENVRVLSEMFNMLFGYYSHNPEQQKNLTEQFSLVNFTTSSRKRAADDEERRYYEELQKRFVGEMKSLSMLPYLVKGEGKEIVHYTSIEAGVVKVLDPNLCKLIKNLTDEQQTQFLSVIENYAQQVATLPCRDILQWSEVVASWGEANTSWYITLDQICASIQDKGQELHDFLLFLKGIGQDGTDLMKRYPLIPNREGKLCKLDYLRVGGAIPEQLYTIARPIAPQKVDVLVDISFEDVCDRTEYTMANLRDDIGSSIDRLRKQTLEYSESLKSQPRLLAACENAIKVEELIAFCSAFPTEKPTGLRADLMPVIAEFYDTKFASIYIPNEKIEVDAQEDYLYIRAFNYLVEHTMCKISRMPHTWLTEDENRELNRNRLLQFVELYVQSTEKNQGKMERLKKWAIFPNQVGHMCLLNDECFLKNETVEDDVADLYEEVMGKNLRETWVADDFKGFYHFKEQSPKAVGKEMEDEKLRPYLEEKRKVGAKFSTNEKLEKAMLIIVNHLEKKEWEEYFDYFALDSNLRNISYELGTQEQKDALYHIKINTTKDSLDSLVKITSKPNAMAILAKAEREVELEQEHERQFNFTFAIGTLIESEIRNTIDAALNLNVVYRKTLENYTATNEQNGQDIVIKRGEEPVYYIECKTKWNFNKPAYMSSQQVKQAVRKRECYALCCIDCTKDGCKISPDAKIERVEAASEDIINHTYVHTDIGHRLKVPLESLINEEDSEAKRNDNDKNNHIGISSSLSCSIPRYVFVRGRKFKVFLEYLKDYLTKLEDEYPKKQDRL